MYKSAIKTHITPEGLQKLLTFAYLILQIDVKGFKYSTDTQNNNLNIKLQEIDLWRDNKIKQFGG